MRWLEVFGIKVCQKYVKADFGEKHHAKNIVFMRFETHKNNFYTKMTKILHKDKLLD
mgnify:CR=1 FL=1